MTIDTTNDWFEITSAGQYNISFTFTLAQTSERIYGFGVSTDGGTTWSVIGSGYSFNQTDGDGCAFSTIYEANAGDLLRAWSEATTPIIAPSITIHQINSGTIPSSATAHISNDGNTNVRITAAGGAAQHLTQLTTTTDQTNTTVSAQTITVDAGFAGAYRCSASMTFNNLDVGDVIDTTY